MKEKEMKGLADMFICFLTAASSYINILATGFNFIERYSLIQVKYKHIKVDGFSKYCQTFFIII